ncbi:MAG: hypothetical protein NTY77_19815 [Elusimicrobia bacterium]|nr:hypothetical protein [Elusimicrobiota bacterium]
MRQIGLVALLLWFCVPAYAGRDEGDARLTVDSPQREVKPIEPLPETIQPVKPAKVERAARPSEDAAFKRAFLTLRVRAWLTTGSVDTRFSYQKYSQPDGYTGETEERGAKGLMFVYSAEVAPIRWLSGEFQYGQDTHNGTYADHYWLHAPGATWTTSGGTLVSPDHVDDLVLGADARSRRDWTAGTIYARVLDLRPARADDPVWQEALDVAVGYERFRQYSHLTNLSVNMNRYGYYSAALPVGPIAGFDSSYSASWSGPHFGFRNEVAVPCGFSFEGMFLWSPFMVYRGEGYNNFGMSFPNAFDLPTLRDSSPNFIDTAHGTAVHFQLGARWDWRMLRLEAGYQRFYFYSRTGTRTFLAADGSTPGRQLDFATAEMAGGYTGITLRY